MLSWFLSFLATAAPAALAIPLDLHPYMNPVAFDNGDFGSYPVQNFVSSNLTSPRLSEPVGVPQDDDLHILFSPRGHQVKQRGPHILDSAGNLVWMSYDFDQVYSFMAQEYNGEHYLSFWSGNDGIGGHGAGIYYVLDSSYNVVRQYAAGNGLDGDLHEFRFTDDGTALITVYQIIQFDLSDVGGPQDGWIWDSLFQELDVATGKLNFQWRASEHYKMSDSFKGVGQSGAREAPHDFFHINSVEKDDKGNYMISSRYMHSVTYIDGRSGEILWIMGGKSNMFKDLSDGAATNFSWQHDARWQNNHTTVSLFDNGAEVGHYTSELSRGLHIALDTDKMEVELIQQYINPQNVICSSQGSMQVLPSGNVLLSYGYSPVWTEFHANGTVLWDVHYGSKNRFESGDVQSYRVLKYPWVGKPQWPPQLGTWGRRGYVSWNGATEVKTWLLQASDRQDGSFRDVTSFRKRGFETGFDLDIPGVSAGSWLRVVGLDVDAEELGTTEPLQYHYSSSLSSVVQPSVPISRVATIPLLALIGGMCVLSALVGAMLVGGVSVFHRLRIGRGGYQPLSTRPKV